MLNIMYATNETQCVELAYSIISLLKHTKNVHIFLCTNSDEFERSNPFRPESINWLKGVVKYMDSNSFLEQVEIKDIYNEYLKGNANENCKCTRNTLTRLLADKIFLPRGISNIFYFDPDVMFTKDLIPLYQKLQNQLIAIKRYANDLVPGTCYMNLAQLDKLGFFEKSRDFLKKEELRWADQDAMRLAILNLGIEYYDFLDNEVFMNQLHEMREKPFMYHFAGAIPFPVGCVSEEKFIELMPEFSYVKDLLDNYRSSIRFNFQ